MEQRYTVDGLQQKSQTRLDSVCISLCVWCVNECIFSPPVCSFPQPVCRSASGVLFSRGPSGDRCHNGEHGQQRAVFAFEEGDGRVSCYHRIHARPLIGNTLYTGCEGKQLFPQSFIPLRWRAPADGEQCCFCAALSRLRKSTQSPPLPLL